MSDTTDAERFAERVQRERDRWYEYQRNRSTYDGDWNELLDDLTDLFTDA